MDLDEKWYELYKKLYGTSFNRLITVGNINKGYRSLKAESLREIKEHLKNSEHNDEYYISLYDYDSDEKVITWNQTTLEKYEKTAIKNCVLFRFIQNTDIMREEIEDLESIESFMFIRRSINLGFNKTIMEESKKTYDYLRQVLDAKPILMFNGYNEILLFVFTDRLDLKHGSLSCYNLYEYISQELNLTTLTYENVEPYAQVVPLPGTQSSYSRLYTQIYYPEMSYEEIVKNSQEKFLNPSHLDEISKSKKFGRFLKSLDTEIENSYEREVDVKEVIENFR